MSIVTLRHSSRRFWVGRHSGPNDLDTAQLGDLWGDGELLPSPSLLFFLVVLPLSLLPVTMAYYAGTEYGDAFAPGFSGRPWGNTVLWLLAMQLAAVPLMARAICLVARIFRIEADYRRSFLLAAIAPVPLWLSSLALVVPSLTFNLVAGALAVGTSAAMTYQGVRRIFRLEDEVISFLFTGFILIGGMLAWVGMLARVWIP